MDVGGELGAAEMPKQSSLEAASLPAVEAQQ